VQLLDLNTLNRLRMVLKSLINTSNILNNSLNNCLNDIHDDILNIIPT
jgi:hypothetical protein